MDEKVHYNARLVVEKVTVSEGSPRGMTPAQRERSMVTLGNFALSADNLERLVGKIQGHAQLIDDVSTSGEVI